MKTAVAVRHVHFEDLGSFEEILKEADYCVQYIEAGKGNLSSIDPLGLDLLIFLGGPLGAYDEGQYPFILEALAILQKRLQKDLPTLGICLGAQLMARALGANVYPGSQKEIGWKPISLTKEGSDSSLRHLSPERTSIFHWHGDTFDLPKNAKLLASTDICRQQAFSWGKNGLGLQFHPELMAESIEMWLIGHAAELSAFPGSVLKIREETKKHGEALKRQAQKFFSEWLECVLVKGL